MLNRYKKLCLSLMVGLVCFASCDYLEYNEEKAYTDEIVWSNFGNIRNNLYAIYDKIPNGYRQVGNGFLACATDEAENANVTSQVDKFNKGTWNMHNNPEDSWKKNYDGIFLANRFIEFADTVTLNQYKYPRNIDNWRADSALIYAYRGEARFLKAFYYFELIKRYGGVPIVNSSEQIDYLSPGKSERNSYNECVNFIAEQCDDAMVFLRPSVDATLKGHATQGAALALKSRLFLYAASALNNPYGSNDAYYDSCAVNSARLFSMGYGLVNYESLFKPGETLHSDNDEVIFDKRLVSTKAYEYENLPVGFEKSKGYTNPTQDLVDAYEMTDGTAFDWGNPEMAQNPYENRDSRFYATILYNGVSIQGREVETFNGGEDGTNQISTLGTKTGYYLKKFIKTDLDLIEGANQRHVWFYFRYAEILLNYAEAMNELYGPDSDPNGYGKTALEAINEVRARAGQPNLATTNQDEFREKLRNERRIEFAFEGHRFWDVRRWKIAEATIGQPVHGVSIEKLDSGSEVTYSYEVFEVEKREFSEKMYLYPLPVSEILNTTGLTQNPGW